MRLWSESPLSPRFLLSAALAFAFGLAAPACEPRIEEPIPPAQSGPPLRSLEAAQATQNAPAGRCIRQTPDTPVRPVPPSPDPSCPLDPEQPPKLRMGKVAFKEAGGKEVDVEIAEDEHTRERGLMYRKVMEENHGMIFVFEDRREHSFWMKNTCIPLDMLFIDNDGLIVGIEENVPTMNRISREVGCPCKYVLEMNAGWTRKNGVKAGQHVDLKGI